MELSVPDEATPLTPAVRVSAERIPRGLLGHSGMKAGKSESGAGLMFLNTRVWKCEM